MGGDLGFVVCDEFPIDVVLRDSMVEALEMDCGGLEGNECENRSTVFWASMIERRDE